MIHVIYRTCGGEETREKHKKYRLHGGYTFNPNATYQRTEWFDKRKYFKSMAEEIINEDVKVTVVFDGPGDYLKEYIEKNYVEKYPDKFSLINIGLCSNVGSLRKCYEIANEDKISDYFYFLEDDYLHRPGWHKALLDGLKCLPEESIATLYDHPDRYTRNDDICQGQEFIIMTPTSYWRTAESTTCTCIISQQMWQAVNQLFIAYGVCDRGLYIELYKAGVRLWQPIPGYNTHDHVDFLSPFIEWENICKTIEL